MADPRIAALPAWLRLHGTARLGMDAAEAEHLSMLVAAADEIDRLRGALEKIAKRWPCDNADTMARMAKETLGIAPPPSPR